jgi:hypothetical protein
MKRPAFVQKTRTLEDTPHGIATFPSWHHLYRRRFYSLLFDRRKKIIVKNRAPQTPRFIAR